MLSPSQVLHGAVSLRTALLAVVDTNILSNGRIHALCRMVSHSVHTLKGETLFSETQTPASTRTGIS